MLVDEPAALADAEALDQVSSDGARKCDVHTPSNFPKWCPDTHKLVLAGMERG